MPTKVLFNAHISVQYGQFFILSVDDDVVPADSAFRGQLNGLCGAATEDSLLLVTALQNGRVALNIKHHSEEPSLDEAWEEVVEASFNAANEVFIKELDGERFPLALPQGKYRVRYSAKEMQAAWDEESNYEDDPIDHYSLEFWLAPLEKDRIVKSASRVAAQFHRENAGNNTDFGDGSTAAEGRANAQRAEDRERFGERTPSERLLIVKGHINTLRVLDENLLFTLGELDNAIHLAVARWAALRALEVAGLAGVSVLGPAIAALRRGESAPPPFNFEETAWETLGHDLPTTTVAWIPALKSDADDLDDPVQQWYAIPALAATAEEDSLKAAIDAITDAIMVHGPAYRGFLDELRATFPLLGE